MLKDFKQFILRGNVVDLAVAVVVGAAFTSIVKSLVQDIVTPIISAFAGKTNFSGLYFTIHHSKFMYGDLINSVISFLLVASVVFFFIVHPINKLTALANKSKEASEPGTKKCPECLSEVPSKATRCAFCTSKLKKS